MKKYFLCIIAAILSILFLFFSCQNNPFFGIGSDVDAQYPKIKITSPGETDYVGAIFTMRGSASDDKEMDKITISARGMADIVIKATESWSVELNITILEQGSNNFKATVRDKSGKETTTEVNLNLDKIGPDVTLLSPDPSTLPIQIVGRMDFNGTVRDDYQINNNGKLKIYRKSNPDTVVYQKDLNVDLGVWAVTGFDTMKPEVVADLYTLEIFFEDKLGNKTIWNKELACAKEDDIPVTYIETPKPETIPKPEMSRWFTLTGYAIDNRSINKIYYNLEREGGSMAFKEFQEISNSSAKPFFSYSVTFDLTTLDPAKTVGDKSSLDTGNYKVIVYSKDNSNNESPKVNSDFIFDNTVPDIKVLDASSDPIGVTPKQGAYVKGRFNVETYSEAPQQGKVVSYRIMQGEDIKLSGAMSTSDGKRYSVEIDSTLLASDSANMFFKVERNLKFQEISRVIYVDNDAPEITITSHTNNQKVQGAVTLTGTANNNMGIAKVEVCEKTGGDPSTYIWQMATGKFIWSYVIASDRTNDDIETKYGVVSPATLPKTFIARVTDRAGNTKSEEITLEISPKLDYPSVSIDAPENNSKVSGVITILARVEDDDYPTQPMVANIQILKDSDNSLILQKNFSKSDQGFPNLTWVVDTSTGDFTDMTTYRIEVRGKDKTTTYPSGGSRWNAKAATMVSRKFIVDKNAPEITITSPTGYEYKTTSVNFTGKVKDKNNLASTNALIMSYFDTNNDPKFLNIALTPAADEPPYKVWTFNFTIDGTGNGNGFASPTTGDGINWANDAWGNKTQLFGFKATDETGLVGGSSVVVNLDNNPPEVAITYPPNGHVIGYPSGGTLEIKGSLTDTPPLGTTYLLGLENVQIELWQSGSKIRNIKDYGVGVDFSTITGTPASWTVKWSFDSPATADGNYEIRVYAKDNANNTPTYQYKSISIIKSADPPVLTSCPIVSPSNYYNTSVQFNVTGEDRGAPPANGVTKLELLLDGVVQPSYTQNYDGSTLSRNYVFTFNSSSLNGYHDISFRVTDNSGITDTKSAGSLYFDNAGPTINTPTYQTLGYNGNITQYTSYLGFTVVVNDNISLAGDNPQFRIGRTSGGGEIRDWTYFNTMSWVGESQYTAVFDNYEYVFGETGTLYITVKAKDNSGNQTTTTFSITKGPLPSLTMNKANYSYISDKNDTTPNNGWLDISGTVESGTDKLWIKLDSGAEENIVGYTTTFNKQYPLTISDGEHTFRVRSSKNGSQNVVTRVLKVDRTAPTITISDTVVPKTDAGVVNGNNLSGKVIIRGTYNDGFANDASIADAGIRIRIDGGSWINLNTPANVIKNYSAPWDWTYEWDTETLTDVVKASIVIEAECVDLAGNGHSANRSNKNTVPYITTLTSDNQSTYPVFRSTTHDGSAFGFYENDKRYTMAWATPLNINGYNLKSSAHPTVKLGSYTFGVSSSTKNQVKVGIPSDDTNGKSGNINVTVNGVTSNNVMAYVWKFDRIGDNYDTLDARDFDMSLTSNGTAFVTFVRDHQVPADGYSGSQHDYSTYRIREGWTQAYNNGGQVDSVFFTAHDIYDDRTYMSYCYDEMGGNYLRMKRATVTDTTNYHVNIGEGPVISFNTSYNTGAQHYTYTAGSVFIRKTGSGNGYLYVTFYDCDSRSAIIPVTPKFSLASITLSGYDPYNGLFTAQEIDRANNPGFYNSIAVTSGGYPVVSYYSETDNKLNLAYNTASFTPTTFTTRKGLLSGGKYNKMVMSNSDLIAISYQNQTYDLTVGVMQGVADTPSTVILESNSANGVTGFNTSIALDSGKKPYISYLNNTELNLNSALHLARFTGATIDKTNLATQSNWEYMKAPAPVGVQSANTIIKWDGTKPVIAFKANNYIYVARLIL